MKKHLQTKRTLSKQQSTARWFVWIIVFIFAAAIFGVTLKGCRTEITPIPKSTIKSISVVIDDNYPPYSFLDNKGDLVGISIDQWKLWEQKTGIKVNITGMNWSTALETMQSGEYDVIDTIFYNDERAKIFDFSKPYATIEVPIYFNNHISGITDAKTVKGFTVAVKSGDAVIDILKTNGVTDLELFDNYQSIIQAAANHKVTVFAIDRPPADYFLYQYGIQGDFNSTDPLYSGQFHRAVLKGNTELLKLVEAGFANISDSEYKAIDNKYFGTPTLDKTVLKYSGYAIGGVLLVLLILSIWNRTLQSRVKQKTKIFEESEANFKSLFDSSPISLWEQDFSGLKKQLDIFRNEGMTDIRKYLKKNPDKVKEFVEMVKIIRANQASVNLYQAADEKGLLTRLSTFIPDKETHIFIDQLVQIAAGATTFKTETVNRKLNGEEMILELNWVAMPGHEKDLSKVIVSLVDITERKQNEQKLKESENKLRAIFAAIQDVILILDKEGTYLEIAPTDPTNLLRPANELSGMNIKDLFPEGLANLCIDNIQKALKQNTIVSMEYPLTIGGRELWFSASISPMTENTVIWAAHEITEMKQKETTIRRLNAELEKKVEIRTKELRLKNQELEAFTYTVSHDLKAPLRGISGYADLLLQDHSFQLDDDGKDYLKKLIRSSQQLGQLIEDLLTYSRLERRPITHEEISVKDIVNVLLEQREQEIADRQVQIHLDVEDEQIRSSHELVMQIINNYLDNALKFTLQQEHPEVWISYKNKGATSLFSIKDNGAGFDLKYKDKIFEVFQRLHTTDTFTGTGIGLALVKKAAELLGYRVWGEGETGKGATFYLEVLK